MTFVQRFVNIAMIFYETAYMALNYWPLQNQIYEESFPNPKPSLGEAMKNVSLVLLNSHFTLNYPRPYVPNMIEVGGLQINRDSNPLPKDIKEFLDAATDGVIYFSMGSSIQSTTLPNEKREALLRTFASFEQKVMWKWESDDLPGKPDNVFTKKWWPQADILGHPNVKVFITHGGLLGTTEAIYHGVPIIGIPIYGDQELNMARAQYAGYGLTVSYQNLTQESLTWALREVINDPK
jgi:UDP:flavonoid glycosyltransferase YjiC (YdhE family)